uniref:Reverse transcriptase Ty1/copia-type domain-containing protein n=2 Tax=Vitis vinifera TaxID=29760 RepID=A5BWE7_VITVI|nr:hypothetical protein VITISV_002413 [Vitis vinifera]
MNFIDSDGQVDLTHLDVSDFFENPNGKIDNLIEVQRIIHLQNLANQLQDAFIDTKKVTKSYISATNTPARIDVLKNADIEMIGQNGKKLYMQIQTPEDVKPVEYKWVFVRKRNENNEIIRYKVRLVHFGCMWYNRLSEYLLKEGYMNNLICPCIFIKKLEIRFAIIAVYVDDLNLVGTIEKLTRTTNYLKNEFEMKDLGRQIMSRKSKQQLLGYADAEYLSDSYKEILAIHEASHECVWLRSMIQHIQETCGLPSIRDNATMLHEDNVACIAQIKGGFIKGDRTKYISPKFFYSHELQKKCEIDVQHIQSCNNLAYLFTKALPLTILKKLSLFAQCFGFPLKFHTAMEAKHHKMKANFAAVRNQPFAANFLSSQPNSEEFSSEDERLSFLSLGVRKVGPTLGKASDLSPWRCTSLPLASLWEVKDHLEWQVLGKRYEPLQGAPAAHESAETPIGHESNGAVAGDVVHAILNTIAEEAMNFMSYVAEVSRGWDEPNARDMGRMTSQSKAKGEMYILNDGMNMKAEIAAMERRLEELEMNQMQEVQAISQTPLLPMPCAICRSYEHLVDECPTIPAEREMFGDCNTYNSNWRDHPNFSWKPQPPQYKQHVQALPQASSLEQAMVNLSKFVRDFVGNQEAINAQINQRIDRVESSLIKRMDEVQNDLSQKLDILQDSISRLANLNTVQEKENSPSQPYQNSKGIHEVEAQEGESLM